MMKKFKLWMSRLKKSREKSTNTARTYKKMKNTSLLDLLLSAFLLNQIRNCASRTTKWVQLKIGTA